MINNSSKKNNGITLIALVITIIVLLILAGISINMLSGQDGILNKAADAKQRTVQAQTDEKEKLGKLDKYIDEAINGKSTFANKVNAKDYGDEVKGYIDLDQNDETNDWLIFSKEGENIWLIPKNVVEISPETANKINAKTSGRNVWWDGTKYTAKDVVAKLSDTNNWGDYIDETFAEKAMGGPTIEMFVNSYNEIYKDADLKYSYIEDDETTEGYVIKGKESQDYSTVLQFEYPNIPHFVSKSEFSGLMIIGYFLSSVPSGEGLWFVGNNETMGAIGPQPVTAEPTEEQLQNSSLGIRPVVCLKSETDAIETKDDKVWFLGNNDDTKKQVEEYNKKNDSLIIKVNSGDSGKVELPITADNNIVVDWGDGTETKYPIETSDIKEVGKVASLRKYKKLASVAYTEGIIHEYNQVNTEYIVSISGEVPYLGRTSDDTHIGYNDRGLIVEILSWGNVGLKGISLRDCNNLVRIASPNKDSFSSLVDLSWAFDSCVNLEYIPNDFFDNCPKLEDLTRAFQECEKLTGEAPKVWLKVENGESNGYEGIPNGRDCFYNCHGLSNYEEIPVYWK